MPIGDHIRDLRWDRRLKQGELAHRAGIAQNTLSQIELGKTTPSVPTLEKIARGLNVDLSELLLEESALAGKAEAPDTGQPGAEQTARDIAHAEALLQEAQDRKAARRTLASEGVDHATRISDVYDPAVYDVLRRQPSDELAGALLDAERDYVHAEQEYDQLQTRVKQEKEANARLREENARLRQDIAELRSEAEREGARR